MISKRRAWRAGNWSGVARYFLAAVFLASAVGKGFSSPTATTLYGSLVQGHWALHAGVIGLETGLALWLVMGIERRTAGVVVGVLVVVFSGLVVRELMSEAPQVCGCGGEAYGPAPSVRWSLVLSLLRNLLMLGACVALVLSERRISSESPTGDSGIGEAVPHQG